MLPDEGCLNHVYRNTADFEESPPLAEKIQMYNDTDIYKNTALN